MTTCRDPEVLDLPSTHDVVIGSHYVSGGATKNWPTSRRALPWAANTYARGVLRPRPQALLHVLQWRIGELLRARAKALTTAPRPSAVP